MNDLRAIISSALLGTERSPLGQLENPHLEQTRQQLEPRGQARQLLGTAMLALNLARAGQTPNGKLPHATPAPEDVRAEIPQAARERLQQLFAQQTDLIPEWLELANSAGFRVPHQDVIALLDYGRQHLEQRQKVLPLLDSRGRWLAQQNPHWAWAMGDTSSVENALETWEIGSKAARVLALQTIRQHNPEQARNLLETVWKSEPADERKTFLALLGEGLSDADEPFLETCLDDRSKEVKSIAAGLLSQLPDSAFVQRMTARATKLLKTGKKELEVLLPEWENEFLRDGLEKKSTLYNIGDKAYWWQTILSNVPAEFWQQHLKLEPDDILKRLPKEFKSNFINAILEQQLDLDWVEALIVLDKGLLQNEKLMRSVPLERREAIIKQYFLQKDLASGLVQSFDTNWLSYLRKPWSLEFSQIAFQWIELVSQRFIKSSNNYIYSGVSEFALFMPLEMTKQIQTLNHYMIELEKMKEGSQNRLWYIENYLRELTQFISTLETRATMRKELQP